MTRILADITVSLDGFVTGPDPGPTNGLGTGGEALHRWAFSDDPDDQRILSEGTKRSGAVILGRRLFDVVDGPAGWNEQVGDGGREVGTPAFFVVTSTAPATVRLDHLDWTFVTTGLPHAVAAARPHARAEDCCEQRRGPGRRHHGRRRHHRLSARGRAGRRAVTAPIARRPGDGHPAVRRWPAAHTGAAQRHADDDGDAPGVRRPSLALRANNMTSWNVGDGKSVMGIG